jgi:hypothetical protein
MKGKWDIRTKIHEKRKNGGKAHKRKFYKINNPIQL